MDIRDHGGYCCGIKHIYGITNHPAEEIPRQLEIAVENVKLREGLVEVAVTDHQLSIPQVSKALNDCGFTPVTRFRNSNSGNFVTVFHKILGRQRNTVRDSRFFGNSEERAALAENQ